MLGVTNLSTVGCMRPTLRTLADIQANTDELDISKDIQPGTFWVRAVVRGERIEFQLAGEWCDPSATILQHAPTRFLA